MTTSPVLWPSIELLHNVVRTLRYLAEQGHSLPLVQYRAKIKLHGTNCGIQVKADGIVAQSRTKILTPEDDYKGFANWAHNHAGYFAKIPKGCVVFGEWCGPGIEKGVAISKTETKRFAIFAVSTSADIVYDPETIESLLPPDRPAALDVLPWEPDAGIDIDFASAASLETAAQAINARVLEVEKEDPWVKRSFGLSGTGEGLVYYPVAIDGAAAKLDADTLPTWVFKAKGSEHRTVATKAAAQVDANVVASIQDFVALMLTEARLAQGLEAACRGVRDPKLTGAFLAWVQQDVQKESVADLASSNLIWAQVDKAVQNAARNWYRGAT
ncbi:MAG TPA: RNA ligase family protein [Burkholderiaceae bacterium]